MFFSLMFYKAMQSIIALSILLSFGLRSADGDVFFVSAAAAAAAADDDDAVSTRLFLFQASDPAKRGPAKR